jgi:hypothetical protein
MLSLILRLELFERYREDRRHKEFESVRIPESFAGGHSEYLRIM